MSKWEQLKEIKGLVASLVVAFTLVGGIGLALMEWRVEVNVRTAVATALAVQDIATDDKIISMDDEIDANGGHPMRRGDIGLGK